jgi:integrase
MQTTPLEKAKQARKQKPEWPKEVQPGRAVVRVYRRKTPSDNWAFMVANYAEDGKRRFDCYHDEAAAIDAAETLAKRLDSRDYVAASMTKDQAIEYANSNTRLKPYGVTVDAATAVVADGLKTLGELAKISEAIRFYALRHRPVTAKPVAEIVTELLKVKESRGASDRYKADLESRLTRFAGDCNKSCCTVTATDIQTWLDGLRDNDNKPLSAQSYRNYRTTLHTLFAFAVARGYAADNPVERVERIKVKNGNDIEIFTPTEIARLLAAAQEYYPDYVPALVLGAFCGLRSAEIERLSWEDIDVVSKHVTVAASKAKTASRRIVPLPDNAAEWLQPYANKQGRIWRQSSILFYKRQEAVARSTKIEGDSEKNVAAVRPVKWKGNALRHSYASYRFAQIQDAGRVAGEMGNSAGVIHAHYRELVKPQQATAWFNVRPEQPVNVVPMATAQVSN